MRYPCHKNSLILVTTLMCLWASISQAQDVFLAGGHLVDTRAGVARQGNLLIEAGVITGSPDHPPKDFDGRVLDVSGKWIVPGLHDMHTHSVLNQAPGGVTEMLGSEIVGRRMLYAGVTGFLDLFNEENYVFGLRDRRRAGSGSAPMADLYAAGACLTATGGHGTEYPIPARIIDSPADAERQIADLAQRKPDVVKIIYDHLPESLKGKTWREDLPSIDKATLKAAIDAAHARGLKTVVHIGWWQDVRDSVEAGADAITHLPHLGPIPDDLLESMAEAGTTVIATLAVGDMQLVEEEVLKRPMVQAMTNDAILAAYRDFRARDLAQRMIDGLGEAQAMRFKTMRRLADAGVPLVVGTDAGNTMTIQGYSVHRELALMVETVGLSPWLALRAATTTAGDFIGRPVGLSKGDLGSVVVLDASPIASIHNTRKIAHVVHHGIVLDRAALKAKADDHWNPAAPAP